MNAYRPISLALLAILSTSAVAANVGKIPSSAAMNDAASQNMRPSFLPAVLTGINAPSSAQVNDPVTFTLTGSGDTSKCKVHFDAGNGTAYDSFLNGGWFGHYVKYAAPGAYKVTLDGLQGCSGHVEKIVTVTPAPTPPATQPPVGTFNEIVVSPASPIAGLDATVDFKASGSTQGCKAKLDFGDGLILDAFTNGRNPVEYIHKFANPGTYTLKVEGYAGCAGQVSKTITVTPQSAGQSTSGSASWNGSGYKPATIKKITLITQPPYVAGQAIQWMIEGDEGAACGITLAFPSNGNQQIGLTIVPQSQPTGNGKSRLGITHWEPGQFIKAGPATFQALPDPSVQTPCLGGATTTIQVQ